MDRKSFTNKMMNLAVLVSEITETTKVQKDFIPPSIIRFMEEAVVNQSIVEAAGKKVDSKKYLDDYLERDKIICALEMRKYIQWIDLDIEKR